MKERCSECEAQNGVPCPWHRMEPSWADRVRSSDKWERETDDKHRTPDFFRRMSTADYDPSDLTMSQWPAPGRSVESASRPIDEKMAEPEKAFEPKLKPKKRKKSKTGGV